MHKTLLIFCWILLLSCQSRQDNILVVEDEKQETHQPTALKIRVNKYDLSKIASLFGNDLIQRFSLESTAKDYDLNKSFAYAATLPNGTIERGFIFNAELPKPLFQFESQNQTYQVTATQIEDGWFSASVIFEINSIQKTELPEVENSVIEPQQTTNLLQEGNTYIDKNTNTHFFVREIDLSNQFVIGDLSLSDTITMEYKTLKPMEAIDFEYQGIKYQFGVEKIDKQGCEFFVKQ